MSTKSVDEPGIITRNYKNHIDLNKTPLRLLVKNRSPFMSTNPPQRLGKYELQTRLGQGGMAEVWKAFDPQLKRYVAIKFLHTKLSADPELMTRFEREGQAIASLRHPNIVQVYDFQIALPGGDGPTAYMIMDYIIGPTLADYIRKTSAVGNFPSASELVNLFTPISLAVDYAHQHGIIHR